MQQPLTEKPLELIDIYDVVYNPWWLQSWFITTLYISAGITICVGIYLLYRYLKPKPVIPYWQKALTDLATLQKNYGDDPATFYSHLTHILKQFLQARFNLALVGQTDAQALTTLEESHVLTPEQLRTLQELLDGVVYIKFANQEAQQERVTKALATTQSLITTLRIEQTSAA